MTLKQAIFELRAVGCTLRKVDGEYIVRHTAYGCKYHTDCISDAVDTGKLMVIHAQRNRDAATPSAPINPVTGAPVNLDISFDDSAPSNQFAALSAESPEDRLATVPAWEGGAL